MNIVTVGRRLISAEEIALVEPFDLSANPEFKPEKDFKARLVLLNRDTVLLEQLPQEFAEAHGLRLLADDNVALNLSVSFKIETFTPTETFKPTKSYVTRIKWRDLDGNEHSKLLLTEPPTVLAEISRRNETQPENARRSPRRPPRARRSKASEAFRTR
jgi:hypothetical protein